MAEEKSKGKSLKLKKESGEGLKSAVKKPAAETPERKERDSKEAVKSGTKESVRTSFGNNLVKVGKEFAKSNGRGEEGKGSMKEEAKSPVKVTSKGGKVSVKAEGNGNGKDAGKVNGKEQGKSVGKVNGKDSGGVRGSVKAKEDDKDRGGEKAKGKNSTVKSSPVSIPVKRGSATKASAKSIKDESSLRVKKVVQTTTTIATTYAETKKEKKVYSLPGQKHDPPEERDALRIFYSTLREQKPESEMAEFWLMEYGLLPHDEAEKALERKQKLRGLPLKSSTATKSSTPSRASNGSPAVKKSTPVSNGKGKGVRSSSKGKQKREESDSDDDYLEKAATKKKLKAESDSDDDFLQALPKKKLKK